MYIFLSIVILLGIVLFILNSHFWEKTYQAHTDLNTNKTTFNNTIIEPDDSMIPSIVDNNLIETHYIEIDEPFRKSLINLANENILGINTLVRSNRGGYHSINDFSEYPPAQKLFKHMLPFIKKYSHKLKIDPDQLVIQSWYIINSNGNYNISHRHSDAVFSGCYYLDMDEDREDPEHNGSIRFMTPHYEKNEYEVGSSVSFISVPGTDFRVDGHVEHHNKKTNTYNIRVLDDTIGENIPHAAIRAHDIIKEDSTKRGKLFLFPGRQFHQVATYKSTKKERIVIAFNLFYTDNKHIYFLPRDNDIKDKKLTWTKGYIINSDCNYPIKKLN